MRTRQLSTDEINCQLIMLHYSKPRKILLRWGRILRNLHPKALGMMIKGHILHAIWFASSCEKLERQKFLHHKNFNLKMYTLDVKGTFRIEHPPDTYIYHIEPVANGIAAISSDDCLRLIDPLVLHEPALNVVQNIHTEVTCLKPLDAQNSIVCTAGRDGKVNIFDLRAETKVAEVTTGRNDRYPFMSLKLYVIFKTGIWSPLLSHFPTLIMPEP